MINTTFGLSRARIPDRKAESTLLIYLFNCTQVMFI